MKQQNTILEVLLLAKLTMEEHQQDHRNKPFDEVLKEINSLMLYIQHTPIKVWSVETFSWEHGNTLGMYWSKEAAREEMLRHVEKENVEKRETHGEFPEEVDQYLLVQDVEDPDHWFSCINHYRLCEREIK